MIRVVIADDETLARDALRIRLRSLADFEIVGECRDGSEAINLILSLRPDLVFLDVRMPGADGFDVLASLDVGDRPAVIFVTAYAERAVEAFAVEAIDYLLKPFEGERFKQAVERARRAIAASETPAGLAMRHDTPAKPVATPQKWLLSKRGPSARLVRVDDVIWFAAAGDYVEAHTAEGTELLDKSMKALAEVLPRDRFARVHRSAIINAEHVVNLATSDGRDWEIELSTGATVRMSRTYRPELERLLNERL